jgi:hypothetical protein
VKNGYLAARLICEVSPVTRIAIRPVRRGTNRFAAYYSTNGLA